MKKKTIFSCFLIICCAGIFLYDLLSPNKDNFALRNMQMIEGILLGVYGIVFFSLYARVVGDWRIHVISGILFFSLFASVKYEYDSTLFTVVHSFSYTYFLAVTSWVVLSIIRLSKA